MSVLDTRREALDPQAVSQTVWLDGIRVEAATTPPTAAASTSNLSAGVAVFGPRVKGQIAAQEDLDAGALAANKTMAVAHVVYWVPALNAVRSVLVAGAVADFTGAQLPVYPTDAEIQAALPATIPADMWTIAGVVVHRNLAGTISALLDESVRSYGIYEDTPIAAELVTLARVEEFTLPVELADPGDAAAIPVTEMSAVVNLVSGGAETRTLASPTTNGQEMLLCFDTDGGNVVITVASAVNVTGNNTLTFDTAGEFILLKAAEVGGAKRWRVIGTDGVGLTTV